jgi:hypothetical protein
VVSYELLKCSDLPQLVRCLSASLDYLWAKRPTLYGS